MDIVTTKDDTAQVSINWLDGEFDEVVVGPRWQNSIQPDELGGVITRLYLRGPHDSDDESIPPPTILVRNPAYSEERMGKVSVSATLEALRQIQAKLAQAVEEAYQDSLHSPPAEPQESHPSNVNVGVQTLGGDLVGITLRPDWVERSAAQTISENVTKSLKAFLADGSSEEQSKAPDNPHLTRVADIRKDLESIIEEVGLMRVPNPERQQ
ncbi:hypothetical protein [Tessaracoccus sp. OH4464_COT-324]|uniref:hypothetical protein n=1 Tax=Tessaracoccus sp. OH4464_COT-324 TaxID=2491059 RepID=UPI000F63A45D|nr:hypothetical protein [Tessaracoccus sp. OH4464_COT-324]RRD46838.1 hypothetical protein EII42_05230 [Tessaracoccus sp. OH4464_COT-324]